MKAASCRLMHSVDTELGAFPAYGLLPRHAADWLVLTMSFETDWWDGLCLRSF